MAKPFKFRHVNEITGAFVLVVVALLVVAVAAMGRAQGWFISTRSITINLPVRRRAAPTTTGATTAAADTQDEQTAPTGVRPGTDVLVRGNVAGSVVQIHPGGSGLQADLSIRADFARFVHTDSAAFIRRTLGVGDAYIEIGGGRGPELPSGGVITKVAAPEGIEETIEQVRGELVPTIQEARNALQQIGAVAADLRDPHNNLQQTLVHVNHITESIDRGEGVAGKLISDPTLGAEVSKTVPKVNASIDDVQQAVKELRQTSVQIAAQSQQLLEQMQAILKDVHRLTATLPDTVGSINRTADTLPGVILQIQETMRQTQRLVEGMQRNFLLRGSIAPDTTGGKIRPEDVGTGGG